MSRNVIDRLGQEKKYKNDLARPGTERAHSHSERLPWNPEHIPSSPFLADVEAGVSPIGDIKELTSAILHDVDCINDPIPEYDRGYEELGDDYLAWYCPFCFHGQDWGIFFHLQRMQAFIRGEAKDTGESPSPLGRELIRKVLHHELFHFLTEHTAAISSQLRGEKFFSNDVYKDYIKVSPNTRLTEEAMANAYALTRTDYCPEDFSQFKSGSDLRDYLCSVCDKAGPGYKDYRNVSTDDSDPGLLIHRPGLTTPSKPDKLKFKKYFDTFSSALGQGNPIQMPLERERHNWSFTKPATGEVLDKPLLKRVPIYLVAERNHHGLASNTGPGSLDLKIKPHTMRLSDFYNRLKRKHGLEYEEGGKHGKLYLRSKNKRMNAWKRKGKKSERVKDYMVKQVSDFLGIGYEELWESIGGQRAH